MPNFVWGSDFWEVALKFGKRSLSATVYQSTQEVSRFWVPGWHSSSSTWCIYVPSTNQSHRCRENFPIGKIVLKTGGLSIAMFHSRTSRHAPLIGNRLLACSTAIHEIWVCAMIAKIFSGAISKKWRGEPKPCGGPL